MATIGNDKNGAKRILFKAPDGKRKTVRLGKMTMRQATAFKVKLEQLVGKSITGAVDDEVSRWLKDLDSVMYGRLVAVGLAAPRVADVAAADAAAVVRLGSFLDGYIAGRTDVKPRSITNLRAARNKLVEFFGEGRALGSVTTSDAKRWIIWLKENYATATVGRAIKFAKQFFQEAVDDEVLGKTPFVRKIKAPDQANESRKFFVTREVAYKVLDSCPDAETRLLFALSRFGGLRCPSEHLGLTWADVDWERSRFRVRSPKTEHHERKGERWVPIFPELRPYLEEVFDMAPVGTVYVITGYRDAEKNFRTRFMRIIHRAGLTPWPKLFHNLRASRETELAAEYPLHVVCAWIGNSKLIAQKHYLQVTDADCERAAQTRPGSAAHNPAQYTAEKGRNGMTTIPTGAAAGSHNRNPVNPLQPISPKSNPCQELGKYAWRDSNPQPMAP